MKSFLHRLTKVHPAPPESTPNQEFSPSIKCGTSSPILSKKLSLQTQSFSPHPILKKEKERKSFVNSKHKSLHSENSERESVLNLTEREETQRRKTIKITKIVPENKRKSEEMDPILRKMMKKREKMAELDSFEVKFNGMKLAEKVRKRSMKRSNTMILNEDKHRKISSISMSKLQRPSDGMLLIRDKEENIEDPFFRQEKNEKIESKGGDLGLSNNVNFMDGLESVVHTITNINNNNNNPNTNNKTHTNNLNLVSVSKKGRTRKQRTNYRLRFDEKYMHLKYIIFPDDPFRSKWDLMILIFLLYSAIILPYVTAFIDEQIGDVYFCFDVIMDAFFFIDVGVNLLSAYFKNDVLIISHWRIFTSYFCSGWLFIDLSSSIPLDLILESSSQPANGFIRVARIPRLYKLLKMTRLVRILKIIKERNKILRYFNEVFKLNSGLERVIIAILLILTFCHVVACLWYILNNFEMDSDEFIWFYMNDLQDLAILDLYMACLYFTVQTVVTVGYGDLHCYSTYERLFASILMLIGVFVYSFAIGSLTSLMSSVDQKNANYSKSLSILAQIKKEHNVNINLFTKIKNHLKYGQNSEKNHQKLIEELPLGLRTEVIIKIHQEEIQNIPFLLNKPTSFIAFLCPLLKRVKINKNDYIFMRNDPAEEMFFIKSGKVAGVLRKYGNVPFIKIKPGYYFGEVDILFYSNIRRYTFMALKDSEFYILSLRHFKKIFLVEFRETIGMEFIQEAYYRKKRTKKIYMEALALCKANEEKGLNKNNGFLEEKTIGSFNNPQRFRAKESVYNVKGLNLLALNVDKVLGKKSIELAKDNEKEGFMKKENDYFFKEEVAIEGSEDKRGCENIVNVENNNENNQLTDNNDDNKNDVKKKDDDNDQNVDNQENPEEENKNIDEEKNELVNSENNENDNTNEKKVKNFNVKLLIQRSSVESKDVPMFHETHKNDNNTSSNNNNSSHLMPPALPTPAKKSFAAKTLQKVLNITQINKRFSLGENLKKAAQKEALKEKIKFFTDRINKMDQDINNLIKFSRQIQEKYQEKLETLKPKPQIMPPPPMLRKLVKTHTSSHLNFLKSESMKKKHNKNLPNSKNRRKSDTTSAQTFFSNQNSAIKPLEKLGIDSKTEDPIKKTPINLRLQKVKDEIIRSRRASVDSSMRKLERTPSFILKRKESVLEEGSLVSIEENDLKESMVKIRGKLEKSKNILENASRRGSEMLSYRGSCSPRSVIGKNIFNNGSPEKKKLLDLKPLKRTSSIRNRRKSDQFLDISKNFQRNDSGFFIENNNKSVKKLSKKLTMNSEDEGKKNVPNVKNNYRRNSESVKPSGFSKTLRNLENMMKINLTNLTESSISSKSKSSSSGSLSKVSSKKSSRRTSIKGINLRSPQMMKIRKSFRKSKKSIKSFSSSSSKNSMKLKNEKGMNDEDFLREIEGEEVKRKINNEMSEEDRNLIEGIGENLAMRKEDERKKERKMEKIGKFKFLVDINGSPTKK